jgi:3,4-dihydroxy 2-butanone 4-phosphate synthase / GTP cyclohydrolase II
LRCYATSDGLGDQLNESTNGSFFQRLPGSGASVRTVGAEITQETGDFFVSDAKGDSDRPTDGFSSIDQAITALREGKVGDWLC